MGMPAIAKDSLSMTWMGVGLQKCFASLVSQQIHNCADDLITRWTGGHFTPRKVPLIKGVKLHKVDRAIPGTVHFKSSAQVELSLIG